MDNAGPPQRHEHAHARKPAIRGLPVAGGPAHAAVQLRLSWMPISLALFGMTMFVAGSVLLALWGADLATPDTYMSFHMLGLTHVFALGLATSVVMAVLYQFVPANFHANVHGPRRGQLMAVCYMTSVVVFVVSLLTTSLLAAAIAGPLLACAVALFLSQMFSVVARGTRRTMEGGFHITAFISLTGVIVLGALLAASLGSGRLGDPRRLLELKILLAVGGWLSAILMGVSYHTIRGLNASTGRPALVLPTLVLFVAGLLLAAILVAASATGWPVTAAISLAAVATVLFAIDAARLVRAKSTNAAGVTWRGQLLTCTLLILSAAAAAAAPLAGVRFMAMAVAGFLAGVVPTAIVANGNRIVPVLIANRYRGHGREPLSASRGGRVVMALVQALVAGAWLTLQLGIATDNGTAIRLAGVLLTFSAAALAFTVFKQALAARAHAGSPTWKVTPAQS